MWTRVNISRHPYNHPVTGIRFGLRRNLPDSAFLIFVLVLNLVPWFPFIRNGAGGTQIGYPSFGQDQMHYVARAHAIWQGKNPAAAFISTASGIKDGLGNFAEYIFFLPSKLIGINRLPFPDYFYSVLFISSFLSLASCYYFFKFLTKSRIVGASVSLVFIYFSQFIDLSGIHFPGIPIFNRWPTPILHYFLIFLLLRILLDPNLRYRRVLGAFTFAFGFYLYLYSWQTLAALIAGAILISIVTRNSNEIKQLFVIALGGILLAMPAILEILQLVLSSRSEGLLQFVFRQEESRLPIKDKMSYLLVLFALVAWMRRKHTDQIILRFVFLCALAGLIVSNQQVLTGRVVQPGHFHWYFIAPALFGCAALMILQNLKFRKINLLAFLILIGIFGVNQVKALSIAQGEARTQITSGLSVGELKSLQGIVFTQDPSVLDQLASSYRDGLYWHPFGIYYTGSREVAEESVAFSAIWHGPRSPVQLTPLRISCVDFNLDPCSTARMLLGSETDMNWFQFVAKGNPIQQSLSNPDSNLAKSLRAASVDPSLYFRTVIADRNIETFVLTEVASRSQQELLGSDWKLIKNSGKFWIYTKITS